MKYLLDTHVFIWMANEPAKLSSTAAQLITDPANWLLLSLASVWEMQIKIQLGKMRLKLPLTELVAQQRQTNQIQLLPITFRHIITLENLPSHHKDPFDRLLIAQAIFEDIALIGDDPLIAKYPVKVVW